MPRLAHIALVVRDYDEALAFYVGKLGFAQVEYAYQPEQSTRWAAALRNDAGSHAPSARA